MLLELRGLFNFKDEFDADELVFFSFHSLYKISELLSDHDRTSYTTIPFHQSRYFYIS